MVCFFERGNRFPVTRMQAGRQAGGTHAAAAASFMFPMTHAIYLIEFHEMLFFVYGNETIILSELTNYGD